MKIDSRQVATFLLIFAFAITAHAEVGSRDEKVTYAKRRLPELLKAQGYQIDPSSIRIIPSGASGSSLAQLSSALLVKGAIETDQVNFVAYDSAGNSFRGEATLDIRTSDAKVAGMLPVSQRKDSEEFVDVTSGKRYRMSFAGARKNEAKVDLTPTGRTLDPTRSARMQAKHLEVNVLSESPRAQSDSVSAK